MTTHLDNNHFFKASEFNCKCCSIGGIVMDSDLIRKLTMARIIADIPFIINSGYRCASHNKKVGGKPGSSHLKHCAVDIQTLGSRDRFKILTALVQANFKRIGIGKQFIHVDNDLDKAQEVIWMY